MKLLLILDGILTVSGSELKRANQLSKTELWKDVVEQYPRGCECYFLREINKKYVLFRKNHKKNSEKHERALLYVIWNWS